MLTLICGLPNAGKTTYSRRFDNPLHLDEIGTADNVITKMKQIDGDIVVEGFFGTSASRRKIRSAYSGEAVCIFLDISVDESIKRENRNRHPNILRNASKYFEPPTCEEGWNEIRIIRGGKNEQCIYRKAKT